jgi:hypothetical protein
VAGQWHLARLFRGRIHVILDVTQMILSADLLGLFQILNPDRDSGGPVNREHAYHTSDESVTNANGSGISRCGVPAARLLAWILPQLPNKQNCGAGNIGQAVKTLLAACKCFSEMVRCDGPRLFS